MWCEGIGEGGCNLRVNHYGSCVKLLDYGGVLVHGYNESGHHYSYRMPPKGGPLDETIRGFFDVCDVFFTVGVDQWWGVWVTCEEHDVKAMVHSHGLLDLQDAFERLLVDFRTRHDQVVSGAYI